MIARIEDYLESTLAYLRAGQLIDALGLADRVLDVEPRLAIAHNIKGVCLARLGRDKDAEASFKRALTLQPNNVEAFNNLGVSQRRLGKLALAIKSFRSAIALNNASAEAHNNLGNALSDTKAHAAAAHAYLEAIRLNPAYADALHNLSGAYEAMHEPGKAIDTQLRLMQIVGRNGRTLHNLGRLLGKEFRYEQALEAIDEAIKYEPEYAEAYFSRGVVRGDLMWVQGALDDLNHAIELNPGFVEAHFSLSLLLLKLGELDRGFVEYEWRKRLKSPFGVGSVDAPELSVNDELAGKRLLVFAEQGLGDTIMFSRYVPQLADRGANVTLALPENLVSVVKTLDHRITCVREKDAVSGFDFRSALMTLPLATGAGVMAPPAGGRYLSSSDVVRAKWAKRLGPKIATRRIAVCWTSNTANFSLRYRSCPLAAFSTLFSRRAQWVAVQKDVGHDDRTRLREHGVTDLSRELHGFSDTAAVLDLCDLMITVDTGVAHLAGALGRQTFLLLPFSADWRWFMERHTTVWYPSVTLFRQTSPGDWSGALAEVDLRLSTIENALSSSSTRDG